jgi:hypothetical protein
MPSAPQSGGNSSHREDRKDLKELQLFFFAIFVVLAVRCLYMIFSQLRSAARRALLQSGFRSAAGFSFF